MKKILTLIIATFLFLKIDAQITVSNSTTCDIGGIMLDFNGTYDEVTQNSYHRLGLYGTHYYIFFSTQDNRWQMGYAIDQTNNINLSLYYNPSHIDPNSLPCNGWVSETSCSTNFSLSPCVSDCPTGDVFLMSQEDVNNFVSNYPNCTTIDGSLHIGQFQDPLVATDINNISGLSNITQINGSLEIVDNPFLNSIEGLHNVTSVNGGVTIYVNPLLTDLQGLSSLTSIAYSLNISTNALLPNFVGLDNLTSIGNYLSVQYNQNLHSFEGLNSLRTIVNDLYIYDNPNLIDISALNYVSSSLKYDLSIKNNDALTSLLGLQNITSIDRAITIQDNNSLTECAIGCICKQITILTYVVISNISTCSMI